MVSPVIVIAPLRSPRRRSCHSSEMQMTDSLGSSGTTCWAALPGTAGARPRTVRRFLVVAAAAGLAFASVALLGLSTPTEASAATTGAPAVAQCNPPDFPITAGFQVTCTVAVVNTTTSMGATSSTVTTSACLAAAGVVFPSCPSNSGPVTNTTSSTQLGDLSEPVQRHRDGRWKQRVLRCHSHQQRSTRNIDLFGHG